MSSLRRHIHACAKARGLAAEYGHTAQVETPLLTSCKQGIDGALAIRRGRGPGAELARDKDDDRIKVLVIAEYEQDLTVSPATA